MRFRRTDRSAASKALAVSLAAGLALAACGASTSTPSPSPSASPRVSARPSGSATPTPRITLGPGATLRDLAGNRYFGTAVAVPTIVENLKYATLVGAEFSSLTPENVMKWSFVEPARGDLHWDAADTVVDFAQAHDQIVRGHALVWDKQLPAWLTPGTFDKATLTQILHDHITAEVGRYAGKVAAWDVVNEALNDNGSLRNTIWKTTLGPDYIAEAFEWAHAADPKAKLYINDYNAEGLNDKSDALYVLVKSLLDQGVPIGGVGFQTHLDATVGGFPPAMAANLQRFTALGLEVAITELDVRVHVPPTVDELSRQTSYYTQAIGACLAVSGCVGVTVWEFTDRYSWVPSSFPGEGAADLYDSNMNPKPVLTAVRETLAAQP